MKCPRCRLINPDSALQCDCGYVFQPEKLKQILEEQKTESSLPGCADSETDKFLKGNHFLFKDDTPGWRVFDHQNNALLLIQHDIKWKTNAQAWRDDQRTHLSFSLKEAKQPSVLLEVTDPYGRQLGTLKRKNAFLNTWFIHDNSDHPIATFTLSNPFMAILGRKGTFSSNNMPFGEFQISRLSQKFDIHIDWNACPNMDRRMVIGAVILAMNFERKF